MSIRVAIVEDDRVVRENLALLIDGAPGFSCVGSCSSAEEACRRLPAIAPEVVLMDLHLPGQSGIACVSRLKELLQHTQVIMLTVEEDSRQVFECLKAGATGYLLGCFSFSKNAINRAANSRAVASRRRSFDAALERLPFKRNCG